MINIPIGFQFVVLGKLYQEILKFKTGQFFLGHPVELSEEHFQLNF